MKPDSVELHDWELIKPEIREKIYIPLFKCFTHNTTSLKQYKFITLTNNLTRVSNARDAFLILETRSGWQQVGSTLILSHSLIINRLYALPTAW